MYQIIPLETLFKIVVTENCGETLTVTMVNTSITVAKCNNRVNITNCGS